MYTVFRLFSCLLCLYVCTYIYMRVYIHICVCLRMRVHVHAYVCVCMYNIDIYTYMYMYIYIYTCMYLLVHGFYFAVRHWRLHSYFDLHHLYLLIPILSMHICMHYCISVFNSVQTYDSVEIYTHIYILYPYICICKYISICLLNLSVYL